MKTYTLDEMLRERFSDEEIRKMKKDAKKEALALTLKELRRFAGKTQVETAKAADMAQGALSQLEQREDHLLSTLRRYVQALGGDLEVVAVFGDKRLRLHSV